MATDYGVRKAAPKPLALWGVALAALAVVAGVTHYFLARRGAELAAATKAWTVVGPPCPQLSKEAFAAQPYPAEQQFVINGVRWARSSAMVMCEGVASHQGHGQTLDPVCQFSAPRVLHITTKTGDFYFAPGLGQKATVTVRDGVASCVMGASVKF